MEPMSPVNADAALADVARVGPYFSVDTDPDVAGHPLWRPFTSLLGPALADQVATARVRLGTGEPRVAASLLFQGGGRSGFGGAFSGIVAENAPVKAGYAGRDATGIP